MAVIQDIDIYGRDNPDGTPVTYYAASAIKNALYQWVNSKRGDYLMNPDLGGALDNFAFKTLNNDNLFNLKVQLYTSISKDFSPSIKIEEINIIPDYENRLTEIEIIYSIPSEGEADSVSLFLNTKYSANYFEYEEVTLTEFNLYEFVRIKKPDQSSARLMYDYELNSWKWGRYKLINLTPSDSYFSEILLICNGS
jgi:hypothetical protein